MENNNKIKLEYLRQIKELETLRTVYKAIESLKEFGDKYDGMFGQLPERLSREYTELWNSIPLDAHFIQEIKGGEYAYIESDLRYYVTNKIKTPPDFIIYEKQENGEFREKTNDDYSRMSDDIAM